MNCAIPRLPPRAGQTYEYDVTIRDGVGWETTLDEPVQYTVVADNPPAITLFEADSPMREQSRLKVRLQAKDDLAVKQAVVTWHGVTFRQEFSGLKTAEDYTFNIDDPRSVRVAGPAVIEDITVTVADEMGQEASTTRSIEVILDTAPQADQLTITSPINGFFNHLFPVTIAGLDQVDDSGRQGLTVTILDLSSGVEREVYRVSGRSIIRASLKATKDDRYGETFSFKVRLMDVLGQTSDSQVKTVALTQTPNEVRFVNGGDEAVNPAFVAVGQSLPLQIQVYDDAGRPVPEQRVEWKIQAGPGLRNQVLTTRTTDSNGMSLINFNTDRSAGFYRILATVKGFGKINAVHNFDLRPGEIDHIRLAHVPPVSAAEDIVFAISARDSSDNVVQTANSQLVTLRIEHPGFYFGFADNVEIEPLAGPQGGEQGRIRLVNGRADVLVSAVEKVGAYAAQVIFPPDSSLTARYDDDGQSGTAPIVTGSIPLTVLPGPAASLAFSEIARTNHALGDPERLEVTETVTIRLAVADAYGNLATTVKNNQGLPQNTAFNATVTLSGSNHSNGNYGTVDLILARGVAEFPVSDDVAEDVELAVGAITPVPAGFDALAGLPLTFVPQVPAIRQATFETAHNDIHPRLIFTCTKAIENAADADPLTLYLDGQPVAGDFAISDNLVAFTLTPGVQLNKTYTFDTDGSTWLGSLDQDAVLRQQGTVSSPQAAIAAPRPPYALENSTKTLALQTGDGIDRSAVSAGKAFWAETEVDFNWSAGSFETPAFADPAFVDGTEVTLGLTGRHQQADLRLANTISLRVLLVGEDYDQDGLPNEVEIDLDLDPIQSDTDQNGIPDAAEDADADQLTNAEELALGTDPGNPDSDADGLSDFAEISQHQTDPNNGDSDGDGLSDFDEVTQHNTDPNNSDSDGDGLNDQVEISLHNTDPNNADSDGDGLSDHEEVSQYRTSPNQPDSDGDGLSDFDEINQHNTDPNNGDSDGDGLSDFDEVTQHNTDPNNSDSDSDGLNDQDEISLYNTDPNKADSDGDGLNDHQEVSQYNTDPNNSDSDADGLSDLAEVSQHRTDPNNSDSDGDGLSDFDEVTRHNTDPNNSDSDGDGLSDGAEVNQHNTDPNRADSNGDDVPDGLEINTGNNPTDPAGIDIRAWITEFRVSPSSYDIRHSSSDPPAIQLVVTATVTAGALSQSLDVTNERFGTVYSGSDDAVTLHEGNGLFRARVAGTTTLTAALGAFAGQCVLTVKPEIISDPVRLMPLSPEQKLHAGADYGELWLEFANTVPFKATSLTIDGAVVPLYRVPYSTPRPDPVYGEVITGDNGLASGAKAVAGSLTPGGDGSVFYHRVTVSAPAEYQFEISSAEFEDSVMYLFHDDGELDPDDLIVYKDDGGKAYLSKIKHAFEPGDYILAVGAYGLSLVDAVDGSNDDDGIEYGDFTLSIAKAPDETIMLRVVYAAGVPADAQGQISVGLNVWGQESKLNVSGAEDPAGANGIYLEDRLFVITQRNFWLYYYLFGKFR